MNTHLFTVRRLTANKVLTDKKCYWCNKCFVKGEKVIFITPNTECKHAYKKLASNVVMHEEEYNELLNSCKGDENEIIYMLGTHIKKKIPIELTEQQKIKLEAFKTACIDCGFTIETNTKDEVHMRQSGSSLTLLYNPRTEKLSINHRGQTGLFDNFLLHETRANVFNRMQEIIGSDTRDNFKAAEAMSKVFSNADKIIHRTK